MSKIALALAFAMAVIYAVPASACSHDLRTQHHAVRQLRHLDRPILRLTRDESGQTPGIGAVPTSRKSEGYRSRSTKRSTSGGSTGLLVQ